MTDIGDRLGDARVTLLAAPSMSGTETDACTQLLVPATPAETNALWVSYRQDPATCLDQWIDATGDEPRQAAVIVVGEEFETSAGNASVQHVTAPRDLTGLGIEIGSILSEWEGESVVCFDSVTAMLQYVDVETAFEFLHTTTGRLYAAGTRAHFHIDPTAHSTETVDAIISLFDGVVSFDDGEPEIRRRQLVE